MTTNTTTTTMTATITAPDHNSLLTPLLPALPAAAASTQPATKVLPLLSPILRQRVQLLAASPSESSAEPWLRLLCYDTSKAARLAELVRSPALEPHPVSGEVEVDWDYDAETQFRRVDEETLQALVVLTELGIAFRLVYCVNDQEGGGDGWRVGEVTVADKPSPFFEFGGVSSIAEAERQFKEGKTARIQLNGGVSSTKSAVEEDDDDDDDYWGRYDATPARTPAGDKRSPAPGAAGASSASRNGGAPSNPFRPASAEDEYFAQYDQVQPAMDNHDPDEEAAAAHLMPPLGMGEASGGGGGGGILAHPRPSEPSQRSGLLPGNPGDGSGGDAAAAAELLHPRPDSSASSNGSHNVARLEESAGKREASEFGVKQHVSRSIRSLYMLSRASGIDRDEFERIVKTELDVLGMMADED
ncbi:anaphase-promoting complex subunit 2 [Purpureocillium lavendulum]|uniref:Anaphase-promoting complex subunit 2 n=1 Tax=Purpureocillium lavendulum TaxID=1247861 RepID=A0AB34G4A6_9HYPO|nr:anaphase-promoting complex subunit 2 [Purpureocillium lavendulum]